jgi:hypothetical protein
MLKNIARKFIPLQISSLIFIVGVPALAINSSRQEFLTTFEKIIPEGLCESNSAFRKCYSVTDEKCLEYAKPITQACIADLKNQIPDPMTGAHDGAIWGEKIGGCTGGKLGSKIEGLGGGRTNSDECKAATQALKHQKNKSIVVSDKIKTELTKNSPPLSQMLLSKLTMDQANHYIQIIKDFPSQTQVTPKMHSELWKLIDKMNLKDATQIESLKNLSFGAALNNQVSIWNDALESVKVGHPIKSAARIETEKRLNEANGSVQVDYKKIDELIEKIATKKPVQMGTKEVVYDEAKIKNMISHLKDKQAQLNQLFTK